MLMPLHIDKSVAPDGLTVGNMVLVRGEGPPQPIRRIDDTPTQVIVWVDVPERGNRHERRKRQLMRNR